MLSLASMKLKINYKKQVFQSPSLGKMSLDQVIQAVLDLVKENPKDNFRIIIGTDSEAQGFSDKGQKTRANFVTAVIWHHIGHGGRYFWQRLEQDNIKTMRQRIYEEVNLSLSLAQDLLNRLQKSDHNKIIQNLEIHVDVGQNGPTRKIVKEVIGMVRGYGFNCKTKPESYGASCVADKHI